MFPACGQIKTSKVKQNDFRICQKNKGQESQTDGPVSVHLAAGLHFRIFFICFRPAAR